MKRFEVVIENVTSVGCVVIVEAEDRQSVEDNMEKIVKISETLPQETDSDVRINTFPTKSRSPAHIRIGN